MRFLRLDKRTPRQRPLNDEVFVFADEDGKLSAIGLEGDVVTVGSGEKGDTGDQGEKGDPGDPGESGSVETQPLPRFAWCFYQDVQEDVDPESTYFGFDSADLTAVTRIFIDDDDTDSALPDDPNKVSRNVSEWLRYLGSEEGGYLTLFDIADPTLWAIYRVVSGSRHARTYERLHVEYVAHNEEGSWPTNGSDLPSWEADAVVMFSFIESIPDNFADALDIHGVEGSIGPISTHGWTVEAGARASKVFTEFGDDKDLVFTARVPGADGDNISIEYVEPSEVTPDIIVIVDGTNISVALAGTEEGSSSTASEVKAAIESNVDANALIIVTHREGSDGSGIVPGYSWSLSYGSDDTAEPIAYNADFSSGRSIWLAWEAPADMLVEFDTGGSFAPDEDVDDLDTIIAIWIGETIDALTEIASNDSYETQEHDFVPDSYVAFAAIKGTRYLIQVGQYDDGSGDVFLRLNWRPVGVGFTVKDSSDNIVRRVNRIVFEGTEISETAPGEVTIPAVSAVQALDAPPVLVTNLAGANDDLAYNAKIAESNVTVEYIAPTPDRVDGYSSLETSLAGINNDLLFTAKEVGAGGHDVSIEYVAPTEETEDTIASADGDAITVFLSGNPSVAATVEDENNGIDLTFGVVGTIGNTTGGVENGYGINSDGASFVLSGDHDADQWYYNVPSGTTVQEAIDWINSLGGGTPTAALHPAANGSAPVINSGAGVALRFTGGLDSSITSTADDVKAAVEADVDSDALVDVVNAGGNDGSGIVTVFGPQNLGVAPVVETVASADGDAITVALSGAPAISRIDAHVTTSYTGAQNDLLFTRRHDGLGAVGNGSFVHIEDRGGDAGLSIVVHNAEGGVGGPFLTNDYLASSVAAVVGADNNWLAVNAPGNDGSGTITPTPVSGDDWVTIDGVNASSVSITSTADDVKTAIEADPDSDALVNVAHALGNDGSGLVRVMGATPLTPPSLSGVVGLISDSLLITVEGNTIRIEVAT